MSEYRSIELVTAGVSVHIYPDPMEGDEKTPPTIVVTTSASDIDWSIMVNGVVLGQEIASLKRFRPSGGQ